MKQCPTCKGSGEVATGPGESLSVSKGQSVMFVAASQWRGDMETVRGELDKIEAPQSLYDGEYWLRLVQWLGGNNTKIVILDELRKYLAWVSSKPKRARDHKRGFRNWLSIAQSYEEKRDAAQEMRRRFGGR